jgi:hypothetical protein
MIGPDKAEMGGTWAHGHSAERRMPGARTGESRMKTWILITAVLGLASGAMTEEFVLIEPASGRTHGPFKYQEESVVRIGDRIFTLRMTRRAKTPLEQRAEEIIIPSLQFRQAALVDVVNFVREASESADPQKNGISIILKLDSGRTAGPEGDVPRITLNLRRVSVKDALRYIAEVAGLKLSFDGSAILLSN